MRQIALAEHCYAAPFAQAALLAHHAIAEFFFGLGEPDMSIISATCRQLEVTFPNTGYISVTQGLECLLRGEMRRAIDLFQDTIDKQNIIEKGDSVCCFLQMAAAM